MTAKKLTCCLTERHTANKSAVAGLNKYRPAESPIEIGGDVPNERNAIYIKTAKELVVGNWKNNHCREINITET